MEFTNTEKDRINQLYGNDFKEVTPEDIALIQRWEQYKAQNDAIALERQAALKQQVEDNAKFAKKTSDNAAKTLKEIKAAALARLERIDNGK